MQLNSEDLPAPFGPMTEKSSPSRTEKVTPSSALTPGEAQGQPVDHEQVCLRRCLDPVSRMGNSSFRRRDAEVERHDLRVGAQVRGRALT